ncbi:MAG: hypothetical protein NZM44_05290 [Candidatus Calescibacterium sp.]|nr:hypothetical protein [Candidatus Calescibacterium sp.]MCX7758508.1 hypothetical protein [bacterium]
MAKKPNKKETPRNENPQEKADKEFEKKLKKFLRDSAQNIAQAKKNLERKQK